MPGQQQLLVPLTGCALGLGLGLYWWHRRSKRDAIPVEWKEIGKLADLMCYPVKSCATIRYPEFDCSELGLKKGLLRDRVFMVVDEEGKNITARQHPRLTQIFPRIEDDNLILTAEGQESIKVNITSIVSKDKLKASVWGQAVQVVDCGDEVAKWLRDYVLKGADKGMRLVYYYQPLPTRAVRCNRKIFWKIQNNDVGALPDFTSYMLMNKASVDDLNTHLTKPVTANFFRPNFLVESCKAYDEDKWEWVKIGETVFRVVKPCNRCIFTTIDPETGIKDKNMEPLRTLRTYRQEPDPKVRPHVGDSPVLGIHLALRTHGKVKLNDTVYVNYG
ncbi:mitochondrial amidoxime reducing component 2-like [Periplaneta americana]|uniref:mitochondrial amidoxime reducing component 2-like n=1 Tax=Periplaneta americana TaxID=6978 RepID=UPI0037E8D1EA